MSHLKLKKKHISRTKIRVKRLLSFIPLSSDLASISPHVVRTRWKCIWWEFPQSIFFLFCLWTGKPVVGTTCTRNIVEISRKAKVPRQRTLSRIPPRPCTATTAVTALVSTGGPVLAAPARVGCLGSGAPSTTYKPRGPDGRRILNLDRSTVFYRPNQTSTPNPPGPVGNKRPAISAPDAGGVELRPCPLGTMSGGEGQAG